MASGFFALFDDIAVLMDDVAVMSKMATKKTAGILGDDLAVNAEKASGFVSSREMPVLWAITKGSFFNKLIILPLIFLLSAFLPKAVTVILVLGGAFLAYEGAEKIYEFLFHRKKEEEHEIDTKVYTEEEILAHEKTKIKSAIITDFILSLEIVIIALSTVLDKPLSIQIAVTTVVAIIATVGVYGIVALLVRIDDLGYRLIHLNEQEDSFSDKVGHFLVALLPKIIKGLAVVGTIALILVAGGIFVHEIEFIHHLLEDWNSLLAEFTTGLVVGFAVLAIVMPVKKVLGR
jgi:predicted DNA repair protein MutK